MRFFYRHRKILELANRYNAGFTDIEREPSLALYMQEARRRILKDVQNSTQEQHAIREKIRHTYANSTDSLDAIIGMYDIEYAGKNPNYRYWNALLSEEGFTLITGYTPEETQQLTIIDVGAGSNEFLRFLRDEIKVSTPLLHGTDISKASVEQIASDGMKAHLGRLESLGLPGSSFDSVFLSYFIDYDTDQQATFETAVALTKPGGKIVLEGFFPARPYGLLAKDLKNIRFITKGTTAAEDIELVLRSCMEAASTQGKKLVLEKLVAGSRYIYNRLGFNTRPSYFVVMRVG